MHSKALFADVLAQLCDPMTTVDQARDAMARLDGHEVAALPWVFAVLRGSDDPAEVQAAARVLRRWAALPLADALPNALRALIAEGMVGDVNKLAAAALLESLGQSLDEHLLARSLTDPRALKRTALARLVADSARLDALVRALEEVAGHPLERQLALIDDLGALGHPSAARLLGPLAHARDADVAVSAIAALDVLGATGTARALATIAGHHVDQTVRDQAALTLARLRAAPAPSAAQPKARATAPSVSASPGAESHVWLQLAADAAGTDRLLVIAAAPDATGRRDVLTLLLRAGRGIAHYAVAGGLDATGVEALRERIVAGGIALGPISVAEARAMLEAATAETLAAGGAEGVAWAAWRPALAPSA